jgi:hypothetical protein
MPIAASILAFGATLLLPPRTALADTATVPADTDTAAEPVPMTPMPKTWEQAFAKITEDPPPPHIVRHTHYVISNENRHFLYRDSVTGKGGVYVGVGTDQNYMLAGWSRPEVLVLMDFDQVVVDLHRVYRVAFLQADGPAAFLRLWDKKNIPAMHALIDQAYPEGKLRTGAQYAYRISRAAVQRRLLRMKALYKRLGVSNFMDDREQYAYIADLFRNNRVVALRGDLTQTHTVREIGLAARETGLPVRVLYLSNAERYFPFTPEFKENMLDLPVDARTQVLRTANFRRGAYEYNVQSGQNLQAWMRSRLAATAKAMLRWADRDPAHGITLMHKTPAELPHAADDTCCTEARRENLPPPLRL